MVMPVVVGRNQHIFWNLTAHVGLRCPNQVDDVQLGYAIAAEGKSFNPFFDTDFRTICKNVIPGAPYQGTAGDPLTIAIEAHQKKLQIRADGHVSVLPPTGAGMYLQRGERHVFLLVTLVNVIKELTPDFFPRIDKHPKCPAELKSAVRKCCTFSD